MIRTVISETDLEGRTREIVDRVRHGEMAVLEESGEEQIVLLDAADFRLLQALAACATEASDLGKAAEDLGLSQLELAERFHRLGVKDARSEVAVLRKSRRESSRRVDSQALLDSLNRACEDGPTPEEKLVRQLMKQKRREMVKGEW